jgi:hypothetical protein
MAQAPPRLHKWLALAVISGVFAAGWFLVSAWRNVPVIDDWVYASSVEQLLKTGQLRLSDYSAVYPIAQILWGALFARIGGFSFAALRLSTVVIATLGCWAIYLTLCELGVDATMSLLAALTVALYPVYFALAFTFMTDVPFVALSSVAVFFYVSAFVRNRPGRLWAGSGFTLLAFLVRPIAIVLPIAVLAGARPAEWRADARRVLPSVALSVMTMGVLWVAIPRWFGRLPIADQRVEGLHDLMLVPARVYLRWDLNLPFIAVFPFAPLLLSALTDRRRALVITAGAAAMIAGFLIATGIVPTPLPDWQTWSMQDIATRGGLFGGRLQPSSWSVHAMPLLRVAGTVVVSSLIVGWISRPRREWRAARVVIALGALHVVLFNVLWFFNDRYYLVLMPSLAYLAAAPLSSSRKVVWVAGPALAVLAFFAVTGTRDALATNDVAAHFARELEAQGVPPSAIDAGYADNGWRLYVHPENLPPHADPRYDVPFVTSGRLPRYRIVNAPTLGERILRVESLPAAWWQVTDRMYVVERRSPRVGG